MTTNDDSLAYANCHNGDPKDNKEETKTAKVAQHKQTMFHRPDNFVGRLGRGSKRSWKVKAPSISDELPKEDQPENNILPGSKPPTLGGSHKQHSEHSEAEEKKQDSDAVVVLETVESNKGHVSNARRLWGSMHEKKNNFDSSNHSTLTEDSRSRVSKARQVWTNLSSLHSTDNEDNLENNEDSQIENSSVTLEDSFHFVSETPDFHQSSRSMSQGLQDSAVRLLDPPPFLQSDSEDLGCDSQHTFSDASSTKDKIRMWSNMSESNHSCTSGNSHRSPKGNYLPKSSKKSVFEKTKDEAKQGESLPTLEMSESSWNQSFASSINTDVIEDTIEDDKPAWKCAHHIQRSHRPDDMLPLSPSPRHKPSKSLQHKVRALNRPDVWVGAHSKPTRRSWTVKKVVEANEAADGEEQ